MFVENKAEFCDKLCELLRMTGNLGNDECNSLVALKYYKTDSGEEYVSPRFKDNPDRDDGYYDICVSGDSCMGILSDVFDKFIKKY